MVQLDNTHIAHQSWLFHRYHMYVDGLVNADSVHADPAAEMPAHAAAQANPALFPRGRAPAIAALESPGSGSDAGFNQPESSRRRCRLDRRRPYGC